MLTVYPSSFFILRRISYAASTENAYKSRLNLRIIPQLGHLTLAKIQPHHILTFINSLRAPDARGSNYYKPTEEFTKTLTALPFSTYKVIGINIHTFYDEDQLAILFLLLEDVPHKYKAAVYLAVDSGIRISELAGLEWDDISFKTGEMRIQRQREYVSGYGIIVQPPKTESGKRIITLSNTVLDILQTYQIQQKEQRLMLGDLWPGSKYVFLHENGKPMFPQRPYIWFVNFLKKNGLPYITFHSLRHPNASMMIADGVDVMTLGSRLGHADKTVSFNTYGHLLRKKETAVAGKLDERYSKLTPKTSKNAKNVK